MTELESRLVKLTACGCNDCLREVLGLVLNKLDEAQNIIKQYQKRDRDAKVRPESIFDVTQRKCPNIGTGGGVCNCTGACMGLPELHKTWTHINGASEKEV